MTDIPAEVPPRYREKRVREILENTEAVLTGSHFVYTSGRHGSAYINKDAVYPHTEQTRELCRMWAQDFAEKNVEVVVGPELGAVILANNTASELTNITGREVLGISAKKGAEKGSFEFNRGYGDLVKGKRVLVVEDVVTTGGSVKTVIDLVRRAGGEVVGLGVLCNRGNVKPEDVGVDEIDSLVNVTMESWAEEDCGLCRDDAPIDTRVGKGKEFLARKAMA